MIGRRELYDLCLALSAAANDEGELVIEIPCMGFYSVALSNSLFRCIVEWSASGGEVSP